MDRFFYRTAPLIVFSLLSGAAALAVTTNPCVQPGSALAKSADCRAQLAAAAIIHEANEAGSCTDAKCGSVDQNTLSEGRLATSLEEEAKSTQSSAAGTTNSAPDPGNVSNHSGHHGR